MELFFFHITHSLTPWSRVLLEKLTGLAANQKFPAFYGTRTCITVLNFRPPPDPILSRLHPVPTTRSHFLKIHLSIILPSTSWSPQRSLSLRFPDQNPFFIYKNLISSFILNFIILFLVNMEAGEVFGVFIFV